MARPLPKPPNIAIGPWIRQTSSFDVVDPVCGAYVDPQTSAAERWYDMSIHHFCSTACADAFAAEPERYAGPDAAALQDLGVEEVDDDGEVHCRLPGGRGFSFQIAVEMVPYYRRLVARRRRGGSKRNVS